ncbi:MAG TPA: hypothetical protein VFP80_19550, partial [Thermoanaerobaculia bacterium]|nr:hypothetical protein [Thermoanaerobaculia bacterium]
AIGPFKRRMWELDAAAKGPIIEAIEQKFEFLMEKLAVYNTRDLVDQYIPLDTELPEYAAASAELTAAATVDPNEGE